MRQGARGEEPTEPVCDADGGRGRLHVVQRSWYDFKVTIINPRYLLILFFKKWAIPGLFFFFRIFFS